MHSVYIISHGYAFQICRVEDLTVNGLVKGSIVHIHRARTVTIEGDGMISASELGEAEVELKHCSIVTSKFVQFFFASLFISFYW